LPARPPIDAARHIEQLKMQLAALRRARFGRSSEKLDREIE
jgi:transposase